MIDTFHFTLSLTTSARQNCPFRRAGSRLPRRASARDGARRRAAARAAAPRARDPLDQRRLRESKRE